MIQQKTIKNSNNFLDKLENDTTHNNAMKAQVVKLILNFTYLKKANRKEKNINLTMIANMKKIQMITQMVDYCYDDENNDTSTSYKKN